MRKLGERRRKKGEKQKDARKKKEFNKKNCMHQEMSARLG